MPTALELRTKRAKIVHDARELLTVAEKEKREPTAEERGRWETMLQDADKIHADVELMERQERMERELNEPEGRRSDPGQPGNDGASTAGNTYWEMEARDFCPQLPKGEKLRWDARDGEKEAGLVRRAQPRYRDAFRSYLRNGPQGLKPDELRDLQADVDTQAGYFVPTQFAARLILAVKNIVFVRQHATVIPIVGADSMGFPSLETDVADADWTSELLTGSSETSMTVGKRELRPYPLAKNTKVSNKLIRLSAIDVETLLMDRLAYKFGVTEEKAFFTGTGANQPLGVFVASNNGISTARDVSTGNTSTALTPDGLIEAKYALKSQYWTTARWAFNRSVVKTVAKFKDGEGQYIWRPGIVAGEPDRLLNFPLDMSEYVPNTMTTGQYVGILADWSRYWIGDNLQMTIQRLVELYAATNQVGFIARKETDGLPVLEEAFVRVKLA